MIEQEFATPGDAILAHYGVKGMRWGTRKAYVERTRQDANDLRDLVAGKAGVGTALKSSYRRGLNFTANGALAKADRLDAHADRIESGRKTVGDTLRMNQALQIKDLRGGAARARVAEATALSKGKYPDFAAPTHTGNVAKKAGQVAKKADQTTKPYQGAAVAAAGAYYLHKKGYRTASALAGGYAVTKAAQGRRPNNWDDTYYD